MLEYIHSRSEIELLTESKSFYHYNVQGCHGSIIRDSLMPFNQLESLRFLEISETSWHDFFSIIKNQLETKPKLRYLSIQPNLGERGRGPKSQPRDENIPWLQEPLPKLQTLRLSFFALDKKVRNSELLRVSQVIEMVGRLKQVMDSLQTLILDGFLRIESQGTLLLNSQPLLLPQLEFLQIQDLRLSGATISSIVSVETLRKVRIFSSSRPENWTTDNGILDRFLPFSNLREVRLSHAHNYFRCSTCKDTHRIFHVGIAPAFADSKILSKHLPHLEVVKWYSAYAPPLLFQYNIIRNSDRSVNLRLQRMKFQKAGVEDGWDCSDYHGKYPNIEVLPCEDGEFPPRINWQDLVWFEREGVSYPGREVEVSESN
ncbi:hypothetical protein TWF192_005575 [Orbilia oligospora]|uniref:Uncharacterized protein n=1 Tax=Orbilia oligospora TaxID=2813651 RepID=A0A6G1M9F0_ORBOL|nr:hypothetical protein TWF679_001024 [Orbilia oligospora]KAF3224366.1 hypothetical protein TWF191_006149 [Orbilia oligospora]KAF3249503.1 hypothetical protein TWF192_005575 [Orbilia oligospora]